MLSRLFIPASPSTRVLAILAAFVASIVFVAVLQVVPPRFRRHLIMGATFLGGLYFTLEFFLPVHPMHLKSDPEATGNVLTPYIVQFGIVANVIAAWTVGLGVTNLCQVHGKRLLKRAPGAINSAAFFISMISILVVGLLANPHHAAIYTNLNRILFEGALSSLDATVYSIIAFYIVSAAYRAFRVRSLEASLLLGTALVVMLGQITFGQWLTSGLHNPSFHVDVIRSWIMTIANAAANRAITFGLDIGSLAVALRIWLGLERGSYFEGNG